MITFSRNSSIKVIISLISAALVASCTPIDNTAGDLPSDVQLILTPSNSTVYAGENLPVLDLKMPPAYEGNKVLWTSSNPSLIEVSSSGVLSFAVNDIEKESETVKITAKVLNASAVAVIQVKAQITKYQIIDLTKELELKVLDRNVGASSPAEMGTAFEWGGASNADWSVKANTPCPTGWGLLSKLQMNDIKRGVFDIIYDYEEAKKDNITSNYNDKEYSDAIALRNKLGLKPAEPLWTGVKTTAGINYLGMGTDGYWKVSVAQPSDKKYVRCVKESLSSKSKVHKMRAKAAALGL